MKVSVKTYNIKPIVIEREEFERVKSIISLQPNIKFYKMPKFLDEFKYYIIIYGVLILTILSKYFNIGYNKEMLSNINDVLWYLSIIFGLLGAISFVPSLFNYIESTFECKKMNKLLISNIMDSDDYEAYLQKPRF